MEAVKGELAPEVDKLAAALARKAGRVDDLREQLLGRIRWGAARLQASHARRVQRHTFSAWRCAAPLHRACLRRSCSCVEQAP